MVLLLLYYVFLWGCFLGAIVSCALLWKHVHIRRAEQPLTPPEWCEVLLKSPAVWTFAAMVLLKQAKVFSTMAVSVAGGVLHNLGQIAMACVIMGTDVLRYYAPFLILSGTLAGIAIGVLAAIMIRRIDLKA